MAQLTTRTTSAPGATAKGSPLTNAEVDQNFNRLNKAGPQIRPSLLLDFANSESVDNRITFSRASAATYYDANGVLRTVRDNKPRIDFDPVTGECKGLLIEEQRTNISGTINRPSDVSYLNCFGVPNSTTAPDGSYSALMVQNVPSPASVTCLFINALTGVSAGQVYKCSIYLKSGSNPDTTIWAIYDQATSANYGSIQLAWTNGVPSINGGNGTGVITSVGNGWYRVSVTATVPAGKTNMLALLYPSGGGAGNKNIFCWGSQFELGSFETSLIVTSQTFTSRASSATYFDSTGVLRIAGTNQPRYGFGYDTTSGKWVSQGLVLEAAATNLITNSSNFSDWSKGSISVVSGFSAPDGSLSASKFIADTNNSQHIVSRNVGVSGSTTYTWSVYAKQGEYFGFQFNRTDIGGVAAGFNLSTGVVTFASGGTASISSVGNGWYLCSFTYTTPAGTSSFSYGLQPLDLNGGGSVFAGNNSSGIYIWGAQLEANVTATSHIPTFGSTATRAADVSSSAATTRSADAASVKTLLPWFNAAEGTIYTEAQYSSTAQLSTFYIGDGTTANAIWVGKSVGGNFGSAEMYVVSGGSNQGFPVHVSNVVGSTPVKIAAAYKANDFRIASQNVLGTTDTAGTIPACTQALIGQYVYDNNRSQHIKRIAYFPRALTSAELQALTQ